MSRRGENGSRALNLRTIRHLAYRLRVPVPLLDNVCAGIQRDSSAYYYTRTISKKGKTRTTHTPIGPLRVIADR